MVRGRLIQVAIHAVPREVNLHRFFWRELTLLGARLYHREDFEAAVALIADGQIPASALITRTEPLAQAEQAFLALESGAGVMKVLIDCRARAAASAWPSPTRWPGPAPTSSPSVPRWRLTGARWRSSSEPAAAPAPPCAPTSPTGPP